MASALDSGSSGSASSPSRGTWCCVIGQGTLLSQCLSPPRVKMGSGELNPIHGGVEIFLIALCHRNWDKLRPDGQLGPGMQTLRYCHVFLAPVFPRLALVACLFFVF